MADEGGAVAVEAPVVDVSSTESSTGESTQSTETQPTDKLDGRQQPDALKKHIGELRRRAEEITDPVQKKAELDRIKFLYDTSGKGSAYEKVYPTVREAREAKSLFDSVGGKDGFIEMQGKLSRAQEIDRALESGDPAAVEAIWKEAPQGMIKLAPMIFSELEKNSPQEYQKAVVPHAIKFLDSSGFPNAFDKMTKLYAAGKIAEAEEIRAELAGWVSSQRNQTQQSPKVDPRVQELESKLSERDKAEQDQATDRAYSDVVTHAGPVIDKYLRPIVQKLGLSKDQYSALREDTWKHLQDTRNADKTYQTVAQAKQKQGMDAVSSYIKGETESRAEAAAKARANFWYGHQLKNGAVKTPNVTATPITPGVTRGKEPSPSEIDYSAKGIQAAKKQGFKDLADMILAGKAPLKAGGVRQWR